MEKKSKNQMKRGLIITIAALVVVAVLLVVFLLLPDPGQEADPSASPSESFEPVKTYYVVNEQFTKLDRMEVYDGEGVLHNAIDVSTDEEGEKVYAVDHAREGWGYDQEKLRAAAVNVSTMSAMSLVEENASDLSQYGLDKPVWRIKATYDGGARTHEVLVGAATALNDGYYCTADDGNVYAVGAYAIGNITRDEMDYRTYAFFPDYYDQSSMEVVTDGAITYIRLVDPATGYDLEVRKTEEGEFESAPTQMHIDSPVSVFASEDQAETRLINQVVLIKVNGLYIDDPTEEQLAECGLDSPKEVWLKNSDGDEVHYLIGKIVSGNAYVMVEGVNTILTAENVYEGLFQINYADIMYKLLLGDSVRDVAKVNFDIGGEKHTLELSYTEPSEENAAGVVSGSLDGEAISSTNASRLYAATLNLAVYEAYNQGDVTISGSPDIKVEVIRNDGVSHVLELYSVNERRYAVKLDGEEKNFYVHRDTVKVLNDAFGYIQRGETIPRV